MNSNLTVASATQDDIDSAETQEWLDSLQAVLDNDGHERVHFLIEKLLDLARKAGSDIPFSANTAYLNTIPVALHLAFQAIRLLNEKYVPMSVGMQW